MQGEFEAGNYHRAFKHFILAATISKREEEEKGCERESVLFLQLRLDCSYCSFADGDSDCSDVCHWSWRPQGHI